MVLIGLDFDGVIGDCGELKQRAIKEVIGVVVPIEHIRKKFIERYISLEKYNRIKDIVYATNYGLTMKEIPQSKEGISILLKHYEVKIVTSREGFALELMKRWLDDHGYPKLDVISTGYGNGKIIDGVLVDDDLEKLRNSGKKILFVHPYNECDVHLAKKKEIIIVRSWKELLEELLKP